MVNPRVSAIDWNATASDTSEPDPKLSRKRAALYLQWPVQMTICRAVQYLINTSAVTTEMFNPDSTHIECTELEFFSHYATVERRALSEPALAVDVLISRLSVGVASFE